MIKRYFCLIVLALLLLIGCSGETKNPATPLYPLQSLMMVPGDLVIGEEYQLEWELENSALVPDRIVLSFSEANIRSWAIITDIPYSGEGIYRWKIPAVDKPEGDFYVKLEAYYGTKQITSSISNRFKINYGELSYYWVTTDPCWEPLKRFHVTVTAKDRHGNTITNYNRNPMLMRCMIIKELLEIQNIVPPPLLNNDPHYVYWEINDVVWIKGVTLLSFVMVFNLDNPITSSLDVYSEDGSGERGFFFTP